MMWILHLKPVLWETRRDVMIADGAMDFLAKNCSNPLTIIHYPVHGWI